MQVNFDDGTVTQNRAANKGSPHAAKVPHPT